MKKNIKNIRTIFFSFIILIGVIISPANVLAYTQTPATWAKEAVLNSFFHEIAYSSYFQDYDKEVTREEFAMMAVNIYRTATGEELQKPSEYTFTDISSSPYKDEIQIAKNLGIVLGTNTAQTLFSPSNPVTRQEICLMIFRILQKIDPDNNYTDIPQNLFYDRSQIAAWAIKAVDFAYNKGIMQGTSTTRLQISPLNNTTREQGMTLLYRLALNWEYISPISEKLSTDTSLDQKAVRIATADQLEDYLRDSLLNRKRDIRIVFTQGSGLVTTDVQNKLALVLDDFRQIGYFYVPKVDTYEYKLLSPIHTISIKYATVSRTFPESLSVTAGTWEDFDARFLLQVRSGIAEASYNLTDSALRNSTALLERMGKLLYANPELNYVRKYQVASNGTSVYTIRLEFQYTEAATKNTIASVREFASDFRRLNLRPGMTAYEKELFINDHIVLNTEYYLGEQEFADAYYENGVFFSNKAVCQGYASAAKLLLNMSGIYSVAVTGNAGGNPHAWNLVRLYGDYYHLDVTWNDPVPDVAGKVRYDYFNITTAEIQKTHIINSVSSFPAVLGTRYNYFAYSGKLFSSKDSTVAYLKSSIQAGDKTISFKISGYTPSTYNITEIISQAYQELGIATYSYYLLPNYDFGVFTINID